jgi:hypothetical protein
VDGTIGDWQGKGFANVSPSQQDQAKPPVQTKDSGRSTAADIAHPDGSNPPTI